MSERDGMDVKSFLASGRLLLTLAQEKYGRPLSPTEFWWLGVGLAAATLAELGDKPYIAGRLDQLIERLGQQGENGDWLQRFVEELAGLDAEGLLWPVYERNPDGLVTETGLVVTPDFNAEAAYFLALAHIAVALALHNEKQEQVGPLAAAIAELVESGLQPEHEVLVLGSLEAGQQEA